MTRTRAVAVVVVLLAGRLSQADPLPPPLLYPNPSLPPVPAFYRTSAYDVWQHVAVDRQGNFRPRVAYVPPGRAFYSATGEPYPIWQTRPRDWMPYAVD